MKDICLIVQEQNHICMLESFQNSSVQCILNMIFPETVLADHFVALGSKQAGTRLLVLRQKAAASDNSLGSIRHLLHMYPRPVGAEFGNFFVWCLWEPQHSLSPHTHWPGTLFTPLPPSELLLPQRTAKSLPFLAAETTEIHSICTSAFPL